MLWLRYKIRIREFAADNPVPYVSGIVLFGAIISVVDGMGFFFGCVLGLMLGSVQAFQVRRGTPSYEKMRLRQDTKLRVLMEKRDGAR